MMKTQIRLNSVVLHGVGSGPESAALDLIYGFLLTEFGQDVYRYISINQIGDELEEFVDKDPGNKIHVNIRYPVYNDFETKTISEKNRIRLDVVHAALLRVAAQEKKLDPVKLEAIKQKVLEKDFSFDFVLKSFIHKRDKSLIAKIIVRPFTDCFKHYIAVEQHGKIKCEVLVYTGMPFIFPEFFKHAKWKGENELIITGKEKEVEIRLVIDECRLEYKNLTPYDAPPYFTMMRADLSQEEKDKAHLDWRHSLPPSQSAILDYRPN